MKMNKLDLYKIPPSTVILLIKEFYIPVKWFL